MKKECSVVKAKLVLWLELHCCIDFGLVRGIMQTCPASMAYDNQRIRDVVDDAVELDVATKTVVGGLGLWLDLHLQFGFRYDEHMHAAPASMM